MRYTFAIVSALLGVAVAAPQGVTEKLTPTGAAPAGCTGSFDGKFEITVAEVTEKRDLSRPQVWAPNFRDESFDSPDYDPEFPINR